MNIDKIDAAVYGAVDELGLLKIHNRKWVIGAEGAKINHLKRKKEDAENGK